MTSGNSCETRDERGQPELSANSERREAGHSGEGAASALARMISQGQQHRHHTGDADDAAGSRRQ